MCGIFGLIQTTSLDSRHLANEKNHLEHAPVEDNRSSEVRPIVSHELYRGLLALQHRGQDAAGMATYSFSTRHFYEEKNLGLANQVFNAENLKVLKGEMGIAHSRYATMGSDGIRDLQPLITGMPYGIAMGHNGNILNYFALKEYLQNEFNIQLLTNNDLEVILLLWGMLQMRYAQIQNDRGLQFSAACFATEKIFEKLQGSYSVVGLIAGEGLFAFRDPYGLRPLCLGKKVEANGNISYAFSSEDNAFNILDFQWVRDVEPGELIFINRQGQIQEWRWSKKVKAQHCMFEWVYFAASESTIQGQSVYNARLRLGQFLAKKIQQRLMLKNLSLDIVVPVPDTGRTAAISIAETMRIPYREGLIKNRYIQRSFILNTQDKRDKAVEAKLSPVRHEIEGKDLLLVDDSLVRGTTSKRMISLLKKYGAKSVTLALTCPPIRHGCYFGIDFPNPTDLLANEMNEEEMSEWLGARDVIFIDYHDLQQALKKEGELCTGCLTGVYPGLEEGKKSEQSNAFIQLRESFRSHDHKDQSNQYVN